MKTEKELQESLLEVINGLLSPKADLRTLAEERKKALEVRDEYAVHLMEILLTAEEVLEKRQMAGTLLKCYVRNHWNQYNSGFVPPVPSFVVKMLIRTGLPNGLSDAISKIRNIIASILVSIAEIDFPHNWPDMCEHVFERLHGADSNTCSGVLEFIKELNLVDNNYYLAYNYSDKVYPLMYEVAQNTVSYSTKIRADAIYLFGNTSSLHSIDREERPDICKLLSEFCYMCKNELAVSHPDERNYYLKGAIIKCYTMLVLQVRDLMTTTANILPTVYEILIRCVQMFDEMLVKESFPDRDLSETIDETPLFYTLVYNVLELLCVLLGTEKTVQGNVKTIQSKFVNLSDLLYYLVLFMAIPKDIEGRWRSDSNAYFDEEFNNESCCPSVRIKARDLLLVMTRELDTVYLVNSLAGAVDKHTLVRKMKSESYYWRVTEALMFAIGSIRTFIFSHYPTYRLQRFDIETYLHQWNEELSRRPTCFMAARINWIGGCYALILEENDLRTYLMDTIQNLREPSHILRYSAIRAISLHAATITVSEYQAVYMQVLDDMVNALMYAIDHVEGYVLHLGLFALQLLLNVSPSYIERVKHQVITLITNVFTRNGTRPEFIIYCLPIVKSLTISMPCREALEARFFPFITDVINQTVPPQPDAAKMFVAQSSAIEILNVIVKHSPKPFSFNMFRYGFLAVYTSFLRTDDPIITQSAAHCLRSYLYKRTPQIITFTDNDGRTGVDYILDVLKYVLDHNKMELACKQVGRLFITALHMLGPHLERHTDFLLRAVWSSVQKADTIKVEESLLIIFTYLFYYHLGPALNYLTSVPGPEGQNALVFILDVWLSKNYNYGGKYSGNLNVLTFTRLIEHTILQQDQRVADIKLLDTGASLPFPALESDTDLDNFCAQIPVVLGLIRHLIRVLQCESETEFPEGGRPVMSVGSSEISLVGTRPVASRDSDLDAIAAVYKKSKQQIEMDSTTDCCDILQIHLDPLDATDPIYNIKIKEFLTNFFKKFAENSVFMEYLQSLPNCDKRVLFNIGVNVNGEDLEGAKEDLSEGDKS